MILDVIINCNSTESDVRFQIRGGLVCCGVIIMAHAALAQSPWYVTGGAGIFLRSDSTRSATLFNGLGTTAPGTDTSSFNPGPSINLGVGYKLPLGFRVEGDFEYDRFSTSSVSPFSTDGTFPALAGNRLGVVSGGNRDSYSATVNVFYDLPVPGRFVPYVGVGAGASHGESQTGIFAGPGVSKFTGIGTSGNYALIAAEIGLTIAINQNWAIVPSYRYEHGFSTGPLDANILRVGLRYSF